MPEIGLALGIERDIYDDRLRNWLYWYDQTGRRLPTPEEKAALADRLAQKLRELGLDPDKL
jgi:hypothetical protein